MWRVFLKRGEFRGATIGVFEVEGGYPRLFEESPSPQLAAEQTGDNRRFCVLVKFTFRGDPRQKAFWGTLSLKVNFIVNGEQYLSCSGCIPAGIKMTALT